MKTELKYLTPYMPYGMSALYTREIDKVVVAIEVSVSNLLWCREKLNFKPILRPLSDYTDVNSPSMNELNTDLMNQIEISDYASGYIAINSLSYGSFEDMIQAHIDVFNLIPAGLAVDDTKINEQI